jgi:hypothetical protein
MKEEDKKELVLLKSSYCNQRMSVGYYEKELS